MSRTFPPRSIFHQIIPAIIIGFLGLYFFGADLLWPTTKVHGQESQTLTTVSAATFARRVAPGAIASAFGSQLALQTAIAATQPLPTSLAGSTVRVNGGLASLFFVSPGQINFLIPLGTPPGLASVEAQSGDGVISRGTVEVVPVAPGLFTANSDGRGALAAQLVRVVGSNLRYEPLAQLSSGTFVTRPVEFGPESESLFLIFYLTGLRLADPAAVRVALGGEDYTPSFVGPAPGFAGLDQINLPLPRTFPARGRLSIVVKIAGAGASNDGEIEIGRGEENSRITITEMPPGPVLAGEEIEIRGNGFAANPRENSVLMVADDGQAVRAEVTAATSNLLRVRVPPGAGSGQLKVQRGSSEASAPVSLRTSISGVIEEARAGIGGTIERTGIAGMQVRMLGRPEISTLTGASGAFVLEIPVNQNTPRLVVEVQGTNGLLPYPRQLLSVNVKTLRDNQLPRSVELAAIGGPGFDSQSSQTQFLISGRTPANLPEGHFSSRIAQVTPFGAAINPGLKLTFPNDDGLAAGSTATLFRFDQHSESATLGQFIPIGTARVSANGQTVETSDGAITEGSYYFVSVVRPLAVVIGRVVGSDGRPRPRAIVQARGRSTFTDSYGGFVLSKVPVLSDQDSIRLEVSYQRGDGRVQRNDGTKVELRADEVSEVEAEIVLAEEPINFPPAVLAPSRIEIEAGQTQDFGLVVSDPNGDANLTVEMSGTAQSFTNLSQTGGGTYRLRLSPTTAGEFALQVLARDQSGAAAAQRIEIGVKSPDAIRPRSEWLSLVTTEDTAVAVRLRGSDPQNKPLTYRIVSGPTQGSLSGTGAELSYRPENDFNGIDRFRYVVSNGTQESTEAVVTILVNPVNDAPQLEFETTRAVNAGERLEATITTRDTDGDEGLQIEAEGLPTGATLEGFGPTRILRWQPTITQQGSYVIKLRARDGRGLTVERNLTIVVSAKWAKTSGLEGGIVNALLSHQGMVFAGTFGGGVYRSLDDGKSWTPVNVGLDSFALFTTSLAMHNGAIYVGTVGDGIYRSDNGGVSWVQRANGLTGDGQFVYALTNHNGQLYAGTNAGVYLTTDGGANWAPLSAGLSEASLLVRALWSHSGALHLGTSEVGVYRYDVSAARWLAINNGLDNLARRINDLQTHQSMLYAASDAGLFRFSQAEQRWQLFAAGLPPESSCEALVEVEGVFYQVTGRQAVFRLADGSGQWISMSAGLPAVQSELPLALIAHEKRLVLATSNGIFRTNVDRTVWAYSSAGLETAQITSLLYDADQLYVATLGAGIYRSDDAGRSWIQINNGLTGIARNVNYLYQHSGEIYAGTFGGGVYRFDRTAVRWEEMSNGLTDDQLIVRSLGSHAGALYAGTFGEGIFRFDPNTKRWSAMNNGLPPSAFDVTVLIEYKGRLFAGTYGGGAHRLNDTTERWEPVNTGLESTFAAFVRSLEVHRETLYVGTFGAGVFRTRNNGESWEVINQGLPLFGQITDALESDGEVLYVATTVGVFRRASEDAPWEAAGSDLIGKLFFALAARNGRLAVGTGGNGVSLLADASQSWSERNTGLTNTFVNTLAASGGDLYVGTLGGGLFRSKDGGGQWAKIGTGLPPNANFQSVVINGGTMLAATFGDGIYRSTDGGLNWAAANTGLNNFLVNRLFVNGATVFAGTDGGVFRSTDDGQSWAAANSGIAGRRVLSFGIVGGALYIGTEEGGVYRFNTNDASWTLSGLASLSVSALIAQGETLYAATLGAGLYQSPNGGATWAPINSGLPETLNVYTLATNGNRLYAGSIYGVFVSEDGGANWRQTNAGLSDPVVTSLVIVGDRLFAGVSVGGVFVSRIP
jgi:uncharacterized protein (TIGR03437 family)